ncbi:MAG: hypothetical protein AAF585_19885, partial [Verrucomicrobiota bacterium]
MSFYSSLTLFYPGEPPVIDAAKWKRFGEALREEMGIIHSAASSLNLKFGERIDQDYADINEMDW